MLATSLILWNQFQVGSQHTGSKSSLVPVRKELVAYDWVMSKKQKFTPSKGADKHVYISQDLSAVKIFKSVESNEKY